MTIFNDEIMMTRPLDAGDVAIVLPKEGGFKLLALSSAEDESDQSAIDDLDMRERLMKVMALAVVLNEPEIMDHAIALTDAYLAENGMSEPEKH